jgi:hypothetical protein
VTHVTYAQKFFEGPLKLAGEVGQICSTQSVKVGDAQPAAYSGVLRCLLQYTVGKRRNDMMEGGYLFSKRKTSRAVDDVHLR